MFQRLAIFVFVVALGKTYGQFQLGFGTPTPPGPKTYDPSKFSEVCALQFFKLF